MPSILPTYPDGRIGTGLLLLRLSVAMSILATPMLTPAAARPWGVMLLAIGLLIGLWTRMMAIGCLALLLSCLVTSVVPIGAAAHSFAMLAILLMGSGAYSSDAIIFGRRTIVLGRGPR
ncbi:hypothetical protein CA233_01610 [Sphingomonas sp. ABOLD]|uniref:Uncharacterized protein n=1 Tax=Sphingomonas trueperi TaxID=53317 RepID=A0A7X5Y2B9_9SPHN|nr:MULTISPECIES: hypothetical protein [Sphingomonas]NJB99819.1 hypothetical protein [Sphingomonas trueperi]RSV39736.1 hypothetical protein CA234_14235 [Sphingomonas sp. ABOLE]RSV52401.1 hypothetical protein CA233_01610 [Sphingomonas sp. ABOLD]